MKKLNLNELKNTYWVTLVLPIAFMLLFSTIIRPKFLSLFNILSLLEGTVLLIIIAGGVTVPMCMSEFDLSIGQLGSLSGVVIVILMQNNISIPFAFFISLLIGVIGGAFNGIIISKFKISSIIITIGSGLMFYGITYWFTAGASLFVGIPKNFMKIGQGRILGIPNIFYISLFAIIIIKILTEHTPFGRNAYIIGENINTAIVVGIKIDKIKFIGFIISGFCAALTGALLASGLAAAHPRAADPFTMLALAAVFIGSALHGKPNIAGTVVGAFTIRWIENFLTLIGVSYQFMNVATGLILIAALYITFKRRAKLI